MLSCEPGVSVQLSVCGDPLACAAATTAVTLIGTKMEFVLPYGQYVSLDGVHPNAQGYQEMANAAADALNSTYGFAIPLNAQPVLAATQICQ